MCLEERGERKHIKIIIHSLHYQTALSPYAVLDTLLGPMGIVRTR